MSSKTRKKAGASATAASRAKGAAGASQSARLPARPRLLFAGALTLALVVSVVAGWRPLERYVSARRAPAALAVRLPTAAHSPAARDWLPESERQRLVNLARSILSPDPLDRASLDLARKTLLETGWFRDITSVQRKLGGEVEIAGRWRQPAAVVRWKGRDYLVSDAAELLPLVYEPGAPDAPRVILGASAGPPRKPDGSLDFGARWLGGDIEAAVALLVRLSERDDAWRRVASIDASRWVSNGALALVTPDGAKVVWGSAPGSEQPWEPAPAEKINQFVKLWEDERWLSRGKPLVELHMPVAIMDDRPGG